MSGWMPVTRRARRAAAVPGWLAGPRSRPARRVAGQPSSGLDRVETERFGEILRRAVRERGVGIFLVEHDMSLVTEVCDYICVLDFGRPIFEGIPAEVMASSLVQAAYLGGDDVEDALSLNPQRR
jgi:ABC-type multidrug transport system ATPase subunit